MALGARLCRLREAVGITRAEAGDQVGTKASRISWMERGRIGFQERDVAGLLTVYEVTDPAVRAVYFEMTRQANEPRWWYRYRGSDPWLVSGLCRA